MKPLYAAPLALAVLLGMPFCLSAATIPALPQQPTAPTTWTSNGAEHIFGLPDMKPNKKGVLTLTADALTFTTRSGNPSIPRASITAVSAGNQRVEMWGIGGRILRMAIPDGGGIAAATFMHHRVDMLTVEFTDMHGGSHSAVFFLPANQAGQALQSFALAPAPPHKASESTCRDSVIDPMSVLVASPVWDRAEVPAAYRSLVYEHVVDRLRRTREVGHVYREGEVNAQGGCPQYIVHIAIAAFKQGSSVKRSMLGPVGMFVGTTQIKFDVTFTNASGAASIDEQIAATIRGESESTTVADHVAKNIAKHYATMLKNADKSTPAKPATPAS